METWDEMTSRHRRERREMVQKLADARLTQTEAAKVLKIKLTRLNNYIHRSGIFWPVVRQGRTSNPRHPAA